MKAEEGTPARALARVDPRWDAARTELALAGLHRRRARRRARVVLGAAAFAATLALVAWTTSGADPAPIAPSTATLDRVVRLADGSRLTPDEGAAVVVEHVSDARIGVRIDRGAASLEVVPGLARRFEVRAGDVTVRVIGTAFRVELLDEGRAHVSVEHGHVEVGWPDGRAELVAGEQGVFPPTEVLAAAVSPVEERPSEPTPTAVHETRAPDPSVAAAPASDRWRDLARASRYDEAYAALGPEGARTTAIGDDVEDLLLAADVARLSGHPAEALPWLAAVAREHPADPRVVLATFTRGRLLAELGRSAEAADELERALTLEPSGSLAEDALARAALAADAAGQRERAARLADRYLAEHPSGRWTSRVRALAGGAAGR